MGKGQTVHIDVNSYHSCYSTSIIPARTLTTWHSQLLSWLLLNSFVQTRHAQITEVNSYHSCYSTEYCDKINHSNLEVNSYHSCYSTIIILLVCTLSSYFKSQSKAVQTSSRLAFTLLTSPICPQITLEPFAGKKCVHAKE